jgi:CIC family chloride channel protein
MQSKSIINELFSFNTKSHQSNVKRTIFISFLSVLVGIISGFGAVAFRYMIAFFHNLFFLKTISFQYDSAANFIASYGWTVIFVPVIGMLIVNFLTEKFAPEARGHGVPEVMSAVYENGGKIRPVVSIVKSFASAISIGSGGSVGREGPIVQIGASFGSSLGQLFRLKPREVIILVAAGVAGGIAATFNAPIGGVTFAIELILPEFSILTLFPLIISSTVGTYIASLFLGLAPAFVIPTYHFVSSYEFIFYILLGFLSAFVAILYIKTLYGMEDFFENLKMSPYLKGSIGALILGIIGYLLYLVFGHYYIFGVGYSFITDTLLNKNTTLVVVFLLVFLKIIANSLTLGAGGSGGIFAPSLFMGIGSGAAIGIIVNNLFPNIVAPVSAYALVGMAAVVAGTTSASLTAIVMTFEMTRNYEIMLPLMLAVGISHFTTQLLYKENIYTKKLIRRGIHIQSDKLVSIFKLTEVSEVMNKNIIYVAKDMVVNEALVMMTVNDLAVLPVIDGDEVLGIVKYTDLFNLYDTAADKPILDLMIKVDLGISLKSDTVEAMEKMGRNKIGLLVIRDGEKIVGITTRNKIIRKYFEKRKRLLD